MAQSTHLKRLVHTTVNSNHTQSRTATILEEAFANLHGEFTGRDHNNGANAPTVAFRRVSLHQQAVNDGQCESCCFTGSCLGAAQHIATFNNGRNGLRLNQSGDGISQGFERAQNRFNQSEIGKAHQ